MGAHPLSSLALRNARKRSLMGIWLSSPPIHVIFDAGHRGVILPNDKRDDYELHLVLQSVTTFGQDDFTAGIRFDDSPGYVQVTIPFSAVHMLMSGPLQEQHLWNEDLALAKARHEMSHTPPSRLLH